MGHVINYKVCANTKDAKRQALAEICWEVEHEDWQEGGAYHHKLTWHDDKVYQTRSEAEDAIDRFDNGWYDDHAVLFKNVGKVGATKKMEDLRRRIDETARKKSELMVSAHCKAKKSAYTSCPKCGSKLANKYIRNDNRCPLCGESLYSDTVKARIKGYDEKRMALSKQLDKLGAEQERRAKGDICWLIKYEYHV